MPPAPSPRGSRDPPYGKHDRKRAIRRCDDRLVEIEEGGTGRHSHHVTAGVGASRHWCRNPASTESPVAMRDRPLRGTVDLFKSSGSTPRSRTSAAPVSPPEAGVVSCPQRRRSRRSLPGRGVPIGALAHAESHPRRFCTAVVAVHRLRLRRSRGSDPRLADRQGSCRQATPRRQAERTSRGGTGETLGGHPRRRRAR